MNTITVGKRLRKSIMNSSETIKLKRPRGRRNRNNSKKRCLKVAANQSKHEGITLAFACKADIFKFNYPGDLEITIEAITDATYLVKTINKTESAINDSIIDWIIQLHIVRHEKI